MMTECELVNAAVDVGEVAWLQTDCRQHRVRAAIAAKSRDLSCVALWVCHDVRKFLCLQHPSPGVELPTPAVEPGWISYALAPPQILSGGEYVILREQDFRMRGGLL